MKNKAITPDTLTQIYQTFAQFDIEKWLQDHIGIRYTMPVQIGISWTAGFLLGFIFKRYFTFIFFSTVLVLVSLFCADKIGFVTINWQQVDSMLSWFKQTDMTSSTGQIIEWIKNNIVPFSASIIGFLLGCKVG